MSSANHVRNGFLALSLAIVAISPGAAQAGTPGPSFHAEAPMQVLKEGLSVEQELQREVRWSRRLLSELPAGALERAVQVPLDANRAAAVDKAPHWQSPLRIGVVQPLAPAIALAGLEGKMAIGVTRRAPDGTFTWGTVLRADGAGAIRLHVEGFALPHGAALYVYSRAGEAYGPYTGAGPDGSGDFWTTAVFGREAILQLRFSGAPSRAELRRVALRVTEIGLITRQFAGDLAGILPTPFDAETKATDWPCNNESCIVDANCSHVAAADPAKLAVAKMEWIEDSFLNSCTGGLIADNNPTRGNFFLTANHCFSRDDVARNVTFYWRFATTRCNGGCPSNTGWPFKTTGATVAATGKPGDFTLAQLNTSPPAGSVFLGWTNTPVADTAGTPLYRISNPLFGPQVYSQHEVDATFLPCPGAPRGQKIYSRDVTGAIDGGSSGAPVLNAWSQIVGQLSSTCGFSPREVCASGPGEANATVDSAFAFYYPAVQRFLNP